MLELVPSGLAIDFIGKTKLCVAGSLVVLILGLGSILIRGGLKQGIDFQGGTLLELRLSQPAVLTTVRKSMEAIGLKNGVVQHFGGPHDVLIRIAQQPQTGRDIGTQVQRSLQERLPGQAIELRRVEIVGPQTSTTLRRQALFALFYAFLGMAIYVSGRFEAKWFVATALAVVLFGLTSAITKYAPALSPSILIAIAMIAMMGLFVILELRFALAAIVPLFHDVLVTVAVLSLFDRELSLTIIAALLTIVGYSINDMIIIFDRIRENLHHQPNADLATVINTSVNQTLSRTLLTSGTTLIVVIALFIFGGAVIHDFALTLLVGILTGTYSSICIASPNLLYWNTFTHSDKREKRSSLSARPRSRRPSAPIVKPSP